jgi:GNAT superfamily N-acetyltransferase
MAGGVRCSTVGDMRCGVRAGVQWRERCLQAGNRAAISDEVSRCVLVASWSALAWKSDPVEPFSTIVGTADAVLDQRLSDELDQFNSAATATVRPAEGLSVKVIDGDGELAAGATGWSWGIAAGISKMWVRADSRRQGLGVQLLTAFELEAKSRGCSRVFVTSFSFQAPAFYTLWLSRNLPMGWRAHHRGVRCTYAQGSLAARGSLRTHTATRILRRPVPSATAITRRTSARVSLGIGEKFATPDGVVRPLC